MRMVLLTTVAAAAFSLSVAAIAQTSGGSGSGAGGASGGSSGSVTGGSSGGAAGGTSVRPPSGTMGGASPGGSNETTGSTSGGASSGTSGSGLGGAASSDTSGGASDGAASGRTRSGSSSTTEGAASTTGSTSTNINVTSEQRTEITRVFSSVDAQPVNDVNFSVSVGTVVPETVVTRLSACPSEVVRILEGLPECRYVIVRDQVVIVEPGTRRIVTVIERRG